MSPFDRGPGTSDAFPWRRAMAFGFGWLRLSSAEFWSMTPRELAAAAEGLLGPAAAPLDRASLEHLMARYPDPRNDKHANVSR